MTKQVAKLVMKTADDEFLLMYRSDTHPTLPFDADLPGGTVEEDETPLQAMIREVNEESGVLVGDESAAELFAGDEYSVHGTEYYLYGVNFPQKPEIIMSWEHDSYEWLSLVDFLSAIEDSKDTYMQMVYDTLLTIGESVD